MLRFLLISLLRCMYLALCCTFDKESCKCDPTNKMSCTSNSLTFKVLDFGLMAYKVALTELIIQNKLFNETKPVKNNITMYIHTLRLQNNKLRVIRANWCPYFLNLTNLWLNNNEIEDIDTAAFISLNQLKYLDLSANKLKSIQSGIFLQMTHLTNLNMANNKISALDRDLFQSLSQLEVLYLQSNYINQLED